MTEALQLTTQLHVVVDLAVEDKSELPVEAEHWLIASRCQIEYGESAKSEADGSRGVDPLSVRAAMAK